MKEKIKELQLELIKLTEEFIKGGNNSDTFEIGRKITCIRETLKTLTLGCEWKYIKPNGDKIDSTNVIALKPNSIIYDCDVFKKGEEWAEINGSSDPDMKTSFIAGMYQVLYDLKIETK